MWNSSRNSQYGCCYKTNKPFFFNKELIEQEGNVVDLRRYKKYIIQVQCLNFVFQSKQTNYKKDTFEKTGEIKYMY
jgi:hypothetical protein